MKGLIIIGYPGIGKSSIAGKDGCIDLESSCFYVDGKRDPKWYIPYTNIAMNLANQGYTVFTSSHASVAHELKTLQMIGFTMLKYKNIGDIVVFRPQAGPEWKHEWIERLQKRYERTHLAKDYRALESVKTGFYELLKQLDCSGFDVFTPDSLDYDLYDYVKTIRQQYCMDTADESGI